MSENKDGWREETKPTSYFYSSVICCGSWHRFLKIYKQFKQRLLVCMLEKLVYEPSQFAVISQYTITKQESIQIGVSDLTGTQVKISGFLPNMNILYTGKLNSHIHSKNGLPSMLYQKDKPVIFRYMQRCCINITSDLQNHE